MKKLSLGFIASFLFLSLSASAADFGFGIKGFGGASMITNAKKFYGDDKAGLFNSVKLGGGGGIYGEYNFMDFIGVRVEGLVNFVGTSYGNDIAKGSFSTGLVKVPVLAKIYPMGADAGFSILAGVELGFLPFMKDASAKRKQGDKWSEPVKDDAFIKEGFKTFTVGANVGVDYELTDIGLNFGLSYIYDFTKMFNEDKERKKGVAKDENVNLQNIRLSAGYNFASLMA